MTEIKNICSGDILGKRALCRVDLNVPLINGEVGDDTRIRAALPTIECLANKEAKVILMSHLGRPKGNGFEQEYSLRPVAQRLSDLLGKPVAFATDIVGPDAQAKVAALSNGEVLLLENLRFDSREKKNDDEMCQELASLADVYVNDAFGTAHRSHASTTGVAKLLPAYAGCLLEKEVTTLTRMLHEPKKPFVAVIGGSKVSDKIKVIDALIDICDTLIIGGGMCFTFLLAQDKKVGKSIKEEAWIERSRQTLARAQEKGVRILLPVDIVMADEFSPDANICTVSIDEIPDNMMGLDIGPQTTEEYVEAIAQARTVFWNGPMGVFEIEAFEHGTKEVAYAIANNTQADTIIGGGDSVAAVNKYGLRDSVTFISTGGGASMELVQGEVLPGVKALQ